MANARLARWNRREMLGRLGVGGIGLLSLRGKMGLLAAAGQGGTNVKPLGTPKGAIIRTILKDLPPEALGHGSVLFHEHLSMVLKPPVIPYPRSTPVIEYVVDEMKAAAKDGVSAIVDAGHADMGRSIDALRQISTRSGLPIIASGGYYRQPVYPPRIGRMSEDEIVDELVRDAKAERWGAFGEIGTSEAITPDERKMFRAVGKASVRTGLPIVTHTVRGNAAIEQLDILESVGVGPRQVTIGHLGTLADAEMHKAIAKRGAYVGLDGAGRTPEVDSAHVRLFIALADAGYLDHILLSSDFEGDDEKQLRQNGGAGWAKTLTVLGPKLREAGVKDAMIRAVLVDNPRRFLAFVPKKA